MERNSLTFIEITDIYNGETITKSINNRFYKLLKYLSIKIKSTQITIKNYNDKKLNNNNYIPIKISKFNS